ncbi:glycine betaine/proline transport system ATP-binding protein [Acinetobacter calcoaceticus]|uniref:Glycine betaine/proline transport system ATP-binding protein n=1 Tax=Acinetobacter calcoaceticus TaxID=471 RepID=A0A4R1XYJ5_ACICA|nr:glycine betaine/proline transport system ATP-binding protein [Acinetobacter calcoaceticus]
MSEHAIRIDQLSKLFTDHKTSAATQSLALAQMAKGMSNQQIKLEYHCQVALRAVSLDIPAQQIFCLMGMSGSGKSTLIRHINRLIEPDQGKVWVGDTDLMQLKPQALRLFRRQHISMVFQHFGLFPHLTVLENAEFGLRVKGIDVKERQQQARFWLNEVGLSGYESAYHTQLSGGMQQRVGLARALAAGTDILLMDEPFSALDPLIRGKLQQLLLDLQQRYVKTVVFVTHDVAEARELGGQVALMNQGEVVQVGHIDQLQQSPIDDYVRRFIQR